LREQSDQPLEPTELAMSVPLSRFASRAGGVRLVQASL
jgi:hypothetical protein